MFPAQSLPLGRAEVPSRSFSPGKYSEALQAMLRSPLTPPPQVPHGPSHDIIPTSDLWSWTSLSSLETSICSASF